MIRLFSRVVLWILRKIRREQRTQQEQMEQILLQKKKQEEAIASDKYKEKFEKAWRECSSYGKKKQYSRNYYHRRKSAH